MKKEINKIILKYQNMDSPLIMILHEVQDTYSYLSYEMMDIISNSLNLSINEIYSVASFYHDFKMKPVGKYQISVCEGTVCYIKDSSELKKEIEKILNSHDGEVTKDFMFSLNTARCLGCCSMAPVISINGKIYGNVKVSDVKNILKEYM